MNKIILGCLIYISTFVYSQAPNFQWAKKLDQYITGGASIMETAVDASGYVYATGWFTGNIDFDPGPATYSVSASGRDMFVLKLDPAGNFVWVKLLGNGSSVEEGRGIELDGSGNICLTGIFAGLMDFDPGPGVQALLANGVNGNNFILKLDANGNYIWAKTFSGKTFSNGYGIALDAFGNVYTTGRFADTLDFDPGPGTFKLYTPGYSETFISKLDPNGNFLWAKKFTGNNINEAFDISSDKTGNVYLTGWFCGTVDFDPGPLVYTLTCTPSVHCDIFVVKLESNGNFEWASQLKNGEGTSLVVDPNSSSGVYATGFFAGTADMDPGPGTNYLTSNGSDDIYIVKLDPITGSLIWAKQIGGIGQENFGKVTLDISANIYLAGHFLGTVDLDPNSGVYNLSAVASNAYTAFVEKLNPAGTMQWAAAFGTVGRAVSVDPSGGVYTSGELYSYSDFDPGSGTFYMAAPGSAGEVFVQKMQGAPLKIRSYNSVNEIMIYPNPSAGQFNIVFNKAVEKTEIKIFNSIGQMVLQKNVFSVNEINLTLFDQPDGIYFVEVSVDGEHYKTKIVKE